jgi:hypothetical protein
MGHILASFFLDNVQDPYCLSGISFLDKFITYSEKISYLSRKENGDYTLDGKSVNSQL